MNKTEKRVRALTCAAFAIYLLLLVWIVVFKTDIVGVLEERGARTPVNLEPFGASVINNGSVNTGEIIENALVFIPLGLFMAIFSSRGGVWKAALLGLLSSLVFEAVQYAFALGRADITDVITNTLGAFMGALLWLLIRRIFKRRAEAVTSIAVLCAEALFIGFAILLITANR